MMRRYLIVNCEIKADGLQALLRGGKRAQSAEKQSGIQCWDHAARIIDITIIKFFTDPKREIYMKLYVACAYVSAFVGKGPFLAIHPAFGRKREIEMGSRKNKHGAWSRSAQC